MRTFKTIVVISVFIISASKLSAQSFLQADGPGNTYELINSIFAPRYNAVENPECVHPEFGRHIAEVWDSTLNKYVFEFYIHVTPDNDRCINFDRQRIEIKTYESSPDSLKGVMGETVTYKWKFKLPFGFKPSTSFTHIHQIKAVGGDDGNPIFTLTPRKGSPNKLELKWNNTTNVAVVNLSSFEGVWVECTEIIKIGSYSMVIKRAGDGTTLLSYSNGNIMTIRADNNFIRPKWGIYRSLDHPTDLRDEAVRFSDFYIREGAILTLTASSNPSSGGTISGTGSFYMGSNVTLNATANSGYQFFNWTENGIEISKNPTYTFIINTNRNLTANFLDITSVQDKREISTEFILYQNYPNPFNPATRIRFTLPNEAWIRLSIHNLLGQEVAILIDRELRPSTYSVDFNVRDLAGGIYFYKIQAGNPSLGPGHGFIQTRKMAVLK